MDQPQPLTVVHAVAQGDLLIERRRLDQARALMSPMLKAHPDDAELLYRFALIDYLEDEDDAALATLARILITAPTHYGARVLRAGILENKGDHADAEDVWIGLIRDFPETPELYAGYARLMLAALHLEKAQRLAAEALRFEPQNESALYVMAICNLIDGESGQHRTHLQALVREHPENVSTTLMLIAALQDRRDWAGALRLAQELLRSHPTRPEFIEIVRELKVETHWSMRPLYPMRRWGWGGSIGVWAAAVVGMNVLQNRVPSGALGILLLIWFIYVVYSWVWPSRLKRLV